MVWPSCLNLFTCLSRITQVRAAEKQDRQDFSGDDFFFFFLLCFTCCHVFFFHVLCYKWKKALKDRQSILYRPWALSNLAQPQGSKPFYLLPQIISRTSCFVPSGSSGSIDTLWTVLFVILFFVISWSLRPDVYFVKQQWKQEVFRHWVFFFWDMH